MITVRTITEKPSLKNNITRKNESAKVYMKVKITQVDPLLRVTGEYYFLDSEGRYNWLSDFKPRSYTYAEFADIQSQLPALESSTDVVANFKQRCFEMVKLIIDQEAAEGKVHNFGIQSGNELELVV